MDAEEDERIVPKTKTPELFNLVDENKKIIIDDLKEAVSIPSISNTPEHSEDVLKMVTIIMIIMNKKEDFMILMNSMLIAKILC